MAYNEMSPGAVAAHGARKDDLLGSAIASKLSQPPRPAQAQLPVRIARFVKNRRECVIVTLKEYAGVKLADIRVHAATDEGDLPTSKGVALDIRRLPDLKAAIERAETEAQRIGLLSHQGGGHDL